MEINLKATCITMLMFLTPTFSSIASDKVVEVKGDLLVTHNASVTGDLNVIGKITDMHGSALLPKGAIIMWSGNEIPQGWALCDGENNTPDLRGRFIVGASRAGEQPKENDYYKLEDKGGSREVQLELAQMPKHFHTGTTDDAGSHYHQVKGLHHQHSKTGVHRNTVPHVEAGGEKDIRTDFAGKHNHNFTTDNKGDDKPHENRPPYFALYYIIKL